ncbi:MAG: 2-hydroxyacyl-CoA dehydratase [Planctomycetes bacterium]|nr:2-hydroxyacyl-CoA dehydratase [Planctomycetota bacterium]MBI3845493.1 2-hydroxyacyl-CoA dehydratase [Planctomycetota bacterium]
MTTETAALLEPRREVGVLSLGDAALRWKAEHPGGRAIACYPVYAPTEVIHAAGMLPMALLGGGTTVELTHADARFQSFVCSIAKSSLELGFQDLVRGVDGFVFSNICDVARNLSSVWARNFSDTFVEYLHLPQNSTSSESSQYLASELRRLASRFAEAFGAPVTDDALRRSIATWNAVRARIRALYALRIDSPEKLPITEFFVALRAATRTAPEESLLRLDALLDTASRRTERPRDRIRVVIEGAFCEQPPPGLLEILEESGCYVVEDDLFLGWRWFTDDVSTDGDPFERLAVAYLDRGVASSTRHEGRQHRSLGVIEKVRRARADAVVFLLPKFCEPALFDYVLIKQGLEREHVPQLVVEFEEKMWTFERTRNEIETFVESMLFD